MQAVVRWPGCARAHLVPLVLALGAAVAACSGDNLFPTSPIGDGGLDGGGTPAPGPGTRDATPPTVVFEFPSDPITVAVGDSVFTQVRVGDNQALRSLELSGFALRGSAELGTQERVDRFATKTVEFAGAPGVRDTTILRYLLAAGDTVPESPVYLVATARDTAGNVATDTVRIAVGGPRVQVTSPDHGVEIRAGTSLPVRVTATDRLDRIRSVRLRLSQAMTLDTSVVLAALVESVDTAFTIDVPANVTGDLTMEVFATNARNVEATGRRLTVRVLAPSSDQTPPTVSFGVTARERAELNDTLSVAVSATDDTRVDSVGVSVVAVRQTGGAPQILRVLTRSASAESRAFHFTMAEFGLPAMASDTMLVSFEVTAYARDAAGNCAAATVPDIGLVEPCRNGNFEGTPYIFSDRSGSRIDVMLVRGRTFAFANPADRIADLVSDGQRVFLSNHSRNRVDVLSIAQQGFGTPISVGSEPWGLAIGHTGDTLFVANSGGTNISVVGLSGSSPSESRRIQTADIRLYDVTYDVTTDTVASVVMLDYSDRPQFLGQTSNSQILYSTKPTPTRSDGTVRILDPSRDNTFQFNRGSEIFTGYAAERRGKGIVVNALDAGRTNLGRIVVCPRRRTAVQTDPDCIPGRATEVSDSLRTLRLAGLTDTRLDLGVDAESVGLSDTTFVAVSGDRSTIAFGEGAVDPGRVMLFRVAGTALLGSTVHSQDLIGNAAERVIGLGLNRDGSLGAARGAQVYFFSNDANLDPSLRLQGTVQSGAPSGGVALHPDNADYPSGTTDRLGFASGIDESGVPYIEVIDSYSFRGLRRVYTRDPVVGSVIAVPVGVGDPGYGEVVLRLFALTPGGVVQIELDSL